MSKLTSKYQLTIPKRVAQSAGLEPGDDLECEPAGETIRVRVRQPRHKSALSSTEQLILFDLATERQRYRERAIHVDRGADRGWTRDELYER